MAVKKDGGHMSHLTTRTVRSMKSNAALKTGSPGGLQAKSSETSLMASFPGSPLWSDEVPPVYGSEEVGKYLYKILTNTVVSTDIGDAQSYWGFPAGSGATSEQPSTSDLSYEGAPAIDAIITNSEDKAAAYMPNLQPPYPCSPIGSRR